MKSHIKTNIPINIRILTRISFAVLITIGSSTVHAETYPTKKNKSNTSQPETDKGLLSGVSIGINTMYSDKGFTDYGKGFTILPSISYDNGKVYVRGNNVGYHFIKDRKNDLSVFAQYGGASFDPDRINDKNSALAKLEERDASIFAGASYMHLTRLGGVRGQLTTAVTGDSDGTLAGLTYLGRYKKDKLTVYPSVGLKWQNKSYNDYYYGVTTRESENTGIESYSASDSFHPYINVTGMYDLTGNWGLFMNQNIGYNPDKIYNSPKVDSRGKYATVVGLTYSF